MMPAPTHIPVLLQPVLELLAPRPGEILVDCTVGLAGHSLAIAQCLGSNGRVVGFDLDAGNLACATQRMTAAGTPFVPIHSSFARIAAELTSRDIPANMVLADLGFSSNQMDDATRGLSFQSDAPLDMRLDRTIPLTAADLLATISQRDLAAMIREYGEDPLAGRIAQKLAQNRANEPIATTAQLARLVQEAYGHRARSSRMHPATRTFMALRIAVNDELGALRGLLDSIAQAAHDPIRSGWLQHGARIAVISFHSLEDRLVKHAFADLIKHELAESLTPGRKPLVPSDDEIAGNPRSRSAKLRAIKLLR
jgi:16S rRNA (cytosine1402-N4)-methyltransferase